MEIIETPIFTKLLKELGVKEDDYRALQMLLVAHPSFGDLIVGTGGARKVRLKRQGSGKSGGYRVIYYWKSKMDQIYMLLIYPKNKQDNLNAKEKRILKEIIERI